MAIVIVLALLALTLGFSYALLRAHTSDNELERNQARKGDARTAAQAGMSVALRKLYDGSWGGADTNFAGDLTTDKMLGFTVTYTTGDSSLTSASADWNEYPFRLTIDSKGYSIDPTTAASRSEYTIRTVVQLIRRKLNTNQATVGMETVSVGQSSSSNARIHYPVRLNGFVYIQGEIEFSRSYPQSWRGTEYMTFFDDVYDMYHDFGWDYRPFSGVLLTPSTRQPNTGDVVNVLDAQLHVSRVNIPTSSAPLVPAATSVSGYQLYAKGKTYPAQAISATLDTADVVPNAEYVVTAGTYAADMQTNPLGIYKCSVGSVGLTSNTSLQGWLLACGQGSSSDIHVSGSNITIQAPTLPAVTGDSTNYRLPTLMASDDVRVYDGTNRNITGWVVAGDQFQLEPGAASTTLTVTGGVFCGTLYLDERTGWTQSLASWQSAYTTWNNTILKLGQNIYFPGWLNNNRSAWGIYLTPRLIFNATPNGVKNHVPDLSQPIYIADPSDGGLQWDVVSWKEIGAG